MSSVIVITPLVIAGWPVISAAVTAAVASMGFTLVRASSPQTPVVEESTSARVEIDVQDSEILEGAISGEQIVVERDGVTATFSRDARGALKLCMDGSASKSELKRIGSELIDRVTQQFVYHRVVTELKQRNMTIIDEEVSADRTVKIRVRNLS
jgi:hypothetical protein